MDWSDPAGGVIPSLDAAVFAVLASTTHPLTGRELARLARRGSRAGIQRVLHRLEDQGLVEATEAGAAVLYVLNRQHVAVGAVLALQGLRGQVFDRMRAELASWDPAPVAAAVFGSAARAEATTSSDVDVLVLRPSEVADDDPTWAAQVDRLAHGVRRWSGNYASIVQLTPTQLAEAVERGEPIIEDLRRDQVAVTQENVLDALTRGTQ